RATRGRHARRPARARPRRRGRRSSRERRARRRAAVRAPRSLPTPELDLVALDQRVGEQLLAHALELAPSLRLVAGFDVELDELADPRLPHGEAEVPQAALDRLALRVEDAALRPHEPGRPHPSTTSG